MPVEMSHGAPKPPPQTPSERRESTRKKVVLGGGSVILFLLLFVVILRWLVFEMTAITSGSMEPTLQRGDVALVDHRLAIRSDFRRGDVILFDRPETWSGDDPSFVKRIIGLPGEKVQIFQGRVYINDQPLSEPYVVKEAPLPEIYQPIRLGPDEFYVLGDNRNNSFDSRDEGPIKIEDVQGRLLQIYWPTDRIKPIESPDYQIPSAR